MLMYFNFIISILFMMMSLAFMTLMERKMLGSLHFRLGPDKVGLFGLFQPFSDAIKLFSKDFFSLKFYQYVMWNISPSILIFILISIIFNMPLKNNICISNNSLMLILLLISMSVFPFLISGIMSFSKYSIMGSYRCVVQMISYEIMISFVFIFLMVLLKSFNFFFLSTVFSSYSGLMKFNFIFLFILFLFEMGRTPFDFIEGESELVSGFNTEFWGSYFSMFFIYEYGMLVILTSFISMMVFKFFSLIFFLVLFLMVLIRATFPRYRYDLMVNFMWKHMFFFFSFLLISSFIM